MYPHLCRVCLIEFKDSSDIVPLFEPQSNNVWYYRLINATFRLSVRRFCKNTLFN